MVKLEVKQNVEDLGLIVAPKLDDEARTIASLVGPRSGFRGRALAVIMNVLAMAQAGCMEVAGNSEPDKNMGSEAVSSFPLKVNAMFTDTGVKLFGVAEQPMNFLVRLLGANGELILEQSHDVPGGSYNLDVECQNAQNVQLLELVSNGSTLKFENLQNSDIPEMPER